MHTLFPKEKSRSIKVEAMSLDEFFQGEAKIDLVKIDVEGAEPLVLKGMKLLLKRNPKIKIITEFNPPLLMRANFPPKEYLTSLFDLGFKIYDIDEERKELILVKPSFFSSFIKKYQKAYTNLLCLK